MIRVNGLGVEIWDKWVGINRVTGRYVQISGNIKGQGGNSQGHEMMTRMKKMMIIKYKGVDRQGQQLT